MSAYFAWEAHNLDSRNGMGLLCLFKGTGDFSFDSFLNDLQNGLSSSVLPVEAVVIYCPQYEVARTHNIFCSSQVTDVDFDLLGDRPIWLVGISPSLLPDSVERLKPSKATTDTQRLDLGVAPHAKFLTMGLEQLTDRAHVVLRAPYGYHFAKGSEQCANYFIRAENAFLDEPELSFFSFALLSRLAKAKISKIYVDSASIFCVAYALTSHYCGFDPTRARPVIESFHSWSGIGRLRLSDVDAETVCVISASSKAGLARKVSDQTGLTSESVAMLFSFNPDGYLCVAPLEQPADFVNCKKHEVEDRLPKNRLPIRIVGDHFLAEQKKPRLARLALKHRLPSDVAGTIQKVIRNPIFDLFPRTLSSSPVRAFSLTPGAVDLDDLQPLLRDWVISQLQPFLGTAERSLLVWVEGPNSRSLVRLVAACILLLTGLAPVEVSAAELRSRINDSDVAKVVVCADVVGTGRSLVSVSTSMRNFNPNARIAYLVAFHLPRTSRHAAALRQTVTVSHDMKTPQFQFASWMELPIGPPPSDAVVKAIANLDRQFPDGGLATAPIGSALREVRTHPLTQGAVLLPEACTPESVHLSWIYVVHAAALQRAREFTDANDQTFVLRSDEFEQVLLDPDAFVRFSDPCIRAALLWSAKSAELDYAGHEAASQFMATTLRRWICSDDKCDITLVSEFVFALCSGHLTLASDDLAAVINDLQSVEDRLDAAAKRFLPDLIADDHDEE